MIRFNLYALGYRTERLRRALLHPWTVGAEMPVIPGEEAKAARAMLELDASGASFLNLHQLLFGRENVPALLAMGLRAEESPDRDFPEQKIPVWGSEDAAFRLLRLAARRARRLSVAYCSYGGKTRLLARQMRRLGVLRGGEAASFAAARRDLGDVSFD
jgi:pyruvate formate-lyase activating enzyme-like uncharacterized protein